MSVVQQNFSRRVVLLGTIYVQTLSVAGFISRGVKRPLAPVPSDFKSLNIKIPASKPLPYRTPPDLRCLMYMAAMVPPLTEVETVPRLPVPSRNPLPLSASQEAQVRELYHSRVRSYCAAEIKCTSCVATKLSCCWLNTNPMAQYSPTAHWAELSRRLSSVGLKIVP